MIWIPVVSLAAGALLAQRFKIGILVPATIVAAVVVLAVARAQTASPSSIVLLVIVTGVSLQVGHFMGMLIRRRIRGVGSLPSISQTTSAEDAAR